MRYALKRSLDLLPFDAQSRRAIDETLLDWAHEESAGERSAWAVRTRGAASVSRAVLGAVAAEVVRVPVRWLGRRLLWPAVGGVTLGFLIGAQMSDYDLTLPLFMVPQFMTTLLFGAWFAAGLRARRDGVPVIGFAVVAGVTTLLMTGMLTPLAAQGFRETLWSTIAQVVPIAPLPRQVAEATLVDQLRSIAPSGGWLAAPVAVSLSVFYAGIAAWAGAIVLLASAIDRYLSPGLRGFLIALSCVVLAMPLSAGRAVLQGAHGTVTLPAVLAAIAVAVAIVVRSHEPAAAEAGLR